MTNLVGYRYLHAGIFALCAGLLLAAYYFEYFLHLTPCPLCIMQRLAILSIGVIGLLAAIVNPRSIVVKRGFAFGTLCASGLGLATAARHVWIQHLPPELVPSCGPSLEYLLAAFPLLDALQLLLKGDGTCADQIWSFLGLSMPEWMVLWFAAFALFSFWQLWRPARA